MLSKTTINFATKRGMHVEINEDDILEIYINAEDDEYDLSYDVKDNGFFFRGTLLPQQVKEELPYWITDERHLRSLLEFLVTTK